MNKVTINGKEYAEVNTIGRAIVVVDRGWIFAGDVEDVGGRIILRNAVWVFRWESIGFDGVIRTPEKAEIRKISDVDIPCGSELFRIPVNDSWGL